MRVLIMGDVSNQAVTGVERYTRGLIDGLVRRDDLEVTVALRHAEARHALPAGCRWRVVEGFARRGLFASWLAPPRWLREFDIVHCPIPKTPFLRKPAGVKLAMTIHDLVPLVMPATHRWTYRQYFRWVMPLLARQADAIFADSKSTQHDIRRFYPGHDDRISVVFPGVWPSTFAADESPRQEEPYAIAVATREPRKNLPRLVEAFVKARRAAPAARDRLLLVGKTGWGSDALGRLVAENADLVELLGYVSDEKLQELYRHAKALIYPSLYEGFGLPVLEAMNEGCPVITSDRSSLPEVGGDAVRYVNPEDVGHMAHEIGRLLADPDARRELSARGRARARRFSWDECARQAAEGYRRALSRP